jgi:hypothetical protein
MGSQITPKPSKSITKGEIHMKKIISLLLSAFLIIAAILPASSVNAAGDWRQMPTSGFVKIVETTPLYDGQPDQYSKCGCAVAPQIVKAKMKYQGAGTFYLIETWVGDKIIRAGHNAIEIFPDFKPKRIDIINESKLFDEPNIYAESVCGCALAPQDNVEAIEYASTQLNNGFYKVKTWVGEKWIPDRAITTLQPYTPIH